MKTTKRIATILLAAAMLLICAGCASKPVDNGDAGLYVGTAMQDDAGSSAIMQGVYDKLVNGREYTQTKGEYAGLARFEEALKGDTIEITAIAENEWYEAMSGTWDYVLDGDERHLNIRAFDGNTRLEVYEKQHGLCAACRKHFELDEMHADHIKPWSKGGHTVPDNCQMLCRDCNLSKGAK